MRVLWINAGLLPDACIAIGHGAQVTAGWVNSQLQALLAHDGGVNQYYVLSFDHRDCDVQIGRVHYKNFGEKRGVTYGNYVPSHIEDQARRTILGFRPDIIHVHGTEFFYGRMSHDVYDSAPVVVSIQGVLNGLTKWLTGGLSSSELFWHQFNLKRIRYNDTIFNEQKKWYAFREPQERMIFKQQHYYMGRTAWDHAWQQALNPEAKYYSVNETLRAPFYAMNLRDEAMVRKHSIYCSAAAGYPLKGAHVLFQAAALLKTKYPDIQIGVCAAEKLNGTRSLMARLKDDQYGSYLRSLIKRLNLKDNVVGLPYLGPQQVAEELTQSEIFVLPSFCENSPNSLGEAQLIGVPAIATYVGGTPSVLKNGEEGVLVPSGDPAMLASAIDEYFSNPEMARNYAERARVSALVRHDPKRNALRTLEVYKEIIDDYAAAK